MFDILKAEFRRFLTLALVYAAAHLMVLLFLTRVVDLAQQPDEVYLVIAAVHGLTGLLLGLLQMGGYRRPNAASSTCCTGRCRIRASRWRCWAPAPRCWRWRCCCRCWPPRAGRPR